MKDGNHVARSRTKGTSTERSVFPSAISNMKDSAIAKGWQTFVVRATHQGPRALYTLSEGQ